MHVDIAGGDAEEFGKNGEGDLGMVEKLQIDGLFTKLRKYRRS